MRRYCLAHVADSHFDRSNRWKDTCTLHGWIADDIAYRKPDVVVHAGDVYERESVPEERIHVAAWLQTLADTAPVLVIRGNHDALVDLEIFRKLDTAHPLHVEERCGVHHLGGFAIGAVAWPRKAQLLAAAARNLKPFEEAELAAQALRNVIGGMGIELAEHDGPTVLAAHAMVRGSKTGLGQPLVGCDMEIGIEDLALAGADYVALGHIHMHQTWAFNSATIAYPGSPRRTEFGELEEKGYVFAEFRDEAFDGGVKGPHGWWVKWEHVRTPARPMLLVNTEWTGQGLSYLAPIPPPREAEIRLRYTTDKDQRVAARGAVEYLKIRLMEDGAHSVRLEECVRATTRSRAPELALARTLPEKLEVFWKAKGFELSSERRTSLFAKVAELDVPDEEEEKEAS